VFTAGNRIDAGSNPPPPKFFLVGKIEHVEHLKLPIGISTFTPQTSPWRKFFLLFVWLSRIYINYVWAFRI
jgi:hypothetical protein